MWSKKTCGPIEIGGRDFTEGMLWRPNVSIIDIAK